MLIPGSSPFYRRLPVVHDAGRQRLPTTAGSGTKYWPERDPILGIVENLGILHGRRIMRFTTSWRSRQAGDPADSPKNAGTALDRHVSRLT